MLTRCRWAQASVIEQQYHDLEWGVPEHDDQKLFEFLTLEGAQAGLSWRTVLQKREAYRLAFDQFNVEKIANYSENKFAELIANRGIIRNKSKIRSTVANAQAYITVQQTFGSFDNYLWGFVDGKPIHNHWQSHEQLPAFDDISLQLSKDLQKRGFKFVGKTICYALMQAVGLVNDHTIDCYRHQEVQQL